jgi:hypothetical protein
MKHIHFVIYKTEKYYYLIIVIFLYLFINPFIICIYSEIEFIKPFDDVKIQRKTIRFTEGGCPRTVFINKMINSGIIRMFISFFNFYIYIFYFVRQVFCISTDNCDSFSMRNIFLFICNDFIFLSFDNLMRNRHCI